jgi:hypothetical protein
MVNNFLFHKVSEKEKKDIQIQAKKIVNDFSKQLDKVKENVGDFFIERDYFERDENNENFNKIDRNIFFENAPEKNKDFIMGESKKW